jgi:hypothetical protein
MATEFSDDIVYQFGVLAITYIFLDQVITDFAIQLNRPPDELAARADLIRIPLSRRVEDLRQCIAQPFFETPIATERLPVLFDRASELIRQRNDLVHGHVFTNKETKDVTLVNFGKGRRARLRNLDPDLIGKLGEEIGDLALEILSQSVRLKTTFEGLESTQKES